MLFVAAALGWLALMLAEGRERLSGWGRALGRRSSRGDGVFTAAPAEPLGVVGRRIGAAALGLAVIFPAAVPLLGDSLFGGNGTGGSGGSGSGSGSSVTTINPLVGIASDLTARTNTAVLEYTSSDADPDYLRMITLDTFDGTNWNVARLSAAGNASDLDASKTDGMPGSSVSTQIRMTGLRTPWLPLPYPTQGILGLTGNWAYDAATLDVFARGNDTTAGRSYDVSSRHPVLDAGDLRAAGNADESVARYTALPSGLPALVKTTEVQITKGLSNDYDKALALQQFFLDAKNRFIYTTEIPDFTGSPLVAFLTNRAGFCQQYATMYAVMARMAGLPTRINVGFTQGVMKTPGNWVVSRQNAHAWPEVFFQGIGWVRFEPTPGPSGIQNPTYAQKPGDNGGNGSGLGIPLVVTRSEHNAQRDDLASRDTGTLDAGKTTKAVVATDRRWMVVAGSLAALLVVVSPGAARIVRRRRRLRPHGAWAADPAGRILAAWREVADTSRDLGLPWASSRTPRRTAAALVAYGVTGEAAAAIRRLALAVERVRYARSDAVVTTGSDAGADARLVLAALASASPGKVRWRARLLPGSVLAVAGSAAADTLDWVDGIGARARSVLGRLLPERLVSRGG